MEFILVIASPIKKYFVAFVPNCIIFAGRARNCYSTITHHGD